MGKTKIYYIFLIPLLLISIALAIFIVDKNESNASGSLSFYLQPRTYSSSGSVSSTTPANYTFDVNCYRTTNPPYPNRPAGTTNVGSYTGKTSRQSISFAFDTGYGAYVEIKQNYSLANGANGYVFCGVTSDTSTANSFNNPQNNTYRYIYNLYTTGNTDYENYIYTSRWPYDSPQGSIGFPIFSMPTYYLVYKYSYGITLKDNTFGRTEYARVIYNNSYSFPSNSRTGYNFLGYYTSSSGGSRVTSAYFPGGQSTYYARWSKKTYSINFNANGGSVSPTSKKVSYGDVFNLPTPTRTGYVFNGWSYNGSTYSGGQSYTVPDLGSNNATATFTANWTIEKYDIIYESNDKQIGRADNISYGEKISLLSEEMLDNPVGHYFNGWSYNGSIYSGSYTVPDFGNNGAEVTFTAVWVPRSDYRVNINLLHPDGTEKGTRGTFDLTLDTGQNLTGLTDQPSTPTITFEKTWTISNIVPATGMHIEYVKLSEGSGSLSPNNSTSSGPYTFTGNFTKDPVGDGDWDATITIKMAWNTCTVNFNSGGGTESMKPMTFTYGQPQTLTENAFKKENNVFSHWSGNIEGTTEFYNLQTLTIKPITHNASYTLTANWRGVTTPNGSGTDTNPYIINSVQTLEYIRYQIENLKADTDLSFYKQTANIDISGIIWNPIGTSSNKFKGKYNGNGLVIEGLTTPAQNKGISNVGLFGYTDSATIEKVHVKDAKVYGNQNVGVIVGNATNNTNIENCIIDSCTVSASSTNGLVIGNGAGKMSNILAIGKNSCTSNSLGGGSRNLCIYQIGDKKYRTNSNWADYSSQWGKISANGQVVQKALFWQAGYYPLNESDIAVYNNIEA